MKNLDARTGLVTAAREMNYPVIGRRERDSAGLGARSSFGEAVFVGLAQRVGWVTQLLFK